jgi:hypothetical protein
MNRIMPETPQIIPPTMIATKTANALIFILSPMIKGLMILSCRKFITNKATNIDTGIYTLSFVINANSMITARPMGLPMKEIRFRMDRKMAKNMVNINPKIRKTR